MVIDERGEICVGCESDAVVVRSTGDRIQGWVSQAATPLPALAIAALLTPYWLYSLTMSGYEGAGWFVAWSIGLIAALVGTMVSARATRVRGVEQALGAGPVARALGFWGLLGSAGTGLWLIILAVLMVL